MLLQFPIIMPVPYDGSPMNEGDVKSLMGAFIFVNILNVISLFITLLKWLIYKREIKKNKEGNNSYYSRIYGFTGRWEDVGLLFLWDTAMIVMWGMIIIYHVGAWIAKFL